MSTRSCRGVTLIELVVFIVVVGVAVAGLFSVFNVITAASADPQVRKQMLAIAESLLDEVQLMPFTFCDPDDANAATATNSTLGAGGCATTSEDTAMGNEGESRYLTPRFDNVSDYHGFAMSPGIRSLSDAAISGLENYGVTIAVSQAAIGSGADAIPAADSLRIRVTVTPPSGSSLAAVELEGYRTRYAPTSLP